VVGMRIGHVLAKEADDVLLAVLLEDGLLLSTRVAVSSVFEGRVPSSRSGHDHDLFVFVDKSEGDLCC
jgi:hypothetical protein